MGTELQGKGNTLLNYCGIRGDFVDFTVDHIYKRESISWYPYPDFRLRKSGKPDPTMC